MHLKALKYEVQLNNQNYNKIKTFSSSDILMLVSFLLFIFFIFIFSLFSFFAHIKLYFVIFKFIYEVLKLKIKIVKFFYEIIRI